MFSETNRAFVRMDNECLSRQSSLVINIVGTDDISRLTRLATGFDR
jgi:hypothetical protein